MSPKPRFIVLCERAFTAQGTNNLNLINIFTQIHARSFPVTHPQFALVVSFDSATPGSYTLLVRVSGPDGNLLAESKLPVQITMANWQVIANYEQFVFAKPGQYTFALEIYADGKEKERTPLGQCMLDVVSTGLSRDPGIA